MDDRLRLRTRNLDAFKRHVPDLHKALTDFRPTAQLIIDEAGEPDVVAGGRAVYDGKASEIAAEQLRQFWEVGPSRFITEQPVPGEKLDRYTNRFVSGILAGAKQAGMQFGIGPVSRQSYFLVILGIGLGRHIDELVEMTDCQALVFVDQSLEFLHHSLEVYDWDALLDSLADKGCSVRFIVKSDAEALSESLRATLRGANPCSVDGLTLFIHDQSPALAGLMSSLSAKMDLIIYGLGFFTDETLMVRNAHGNLGTGNARVYLRDDAQRLDVPVFVVATGPSLDESMAFIKENADRAVIISSGSALGSLAANGVVPDFHVETENISVYPVVAPVAEAHDISSVCLLAASTVDPRIIPLFQDVIYFFRAGLSAHPLFCQSARNCMLRPDPTVANASLSFAIEAGFRNIYLFGVDLGSRGTGRHHSKDSYHYTEDAIVSESDLTFDVEVQANFGGSAYCSKDLFAAREAMRHAINENGGGRKFFNCSDGALIEGAAPMRREKLSLPLIKGGKQKICDEIIDGFPVFTSDNFDAAWDAEELVAAINSFLDRVLTCFEAADEFQDKAYLTRLMDLLEPMMTADDALSDRTGKAVMILFRGTLFQIVSALEYYVNRVTEPEKRRIMAEIAAPEFARAVESLREAAIGIVRRPDVAPDSDGERDVNEDEFIAEAPHTWGRVSRNAPCPCGSGKKYKRCHGQVG